MEKISIWTQIEYKLVSLLAKNAGKVLTYDFILKEIWGPYADTDNQILRVNMANIRRKLESNPAEAALYFHRDRSRIPDEGIKILRRNH